MWELPLCFPDFPELLLSPEMSLLGDWGDHACGSRVTVHGFSRRHILQDLKKQLFKHRQVLNQEWGLRHQVAGAVIAEGLIMWHHFKKWYSAADPACQREEAAEEGEAPPNQPGLVSHRPDYKTRHDTCPPPCVPQNCAWRTWKMRAQVLTSSVRRFSTGASQDLVVASEDVN